MPYSWAGGRGHNARGMGFAALRYKIEEPVADAMTGSKLGSSSPNAGLMSANKSRKFGGSETISTNLSGTKLDPASDADTTNCGESIDGCATLKYSLKKVW
jgi:hypothetical protein